MKSKILRLVLLLIPVSALLFISFSSGQPNPYSGSPGDGGQTCAVCHGGGSFNASVTISTDIPEDGFMPGETYNVTVTANSTAPRHGFQITAENTDDAKSGTFTAGTGNQTANNNHLVTHTLSGTSLTEWHMTWTAPEGNADADHEITFYAALNAANNNNSTSGDQIVTTNISFSRSNLSTDEEAIRKIRISPNPVRETIQLDGMFDDARYGIYDMNGSLIQSGVISGGMMNIKSSITPGIYYLSVEKDGKTYGTKFIKK